MTSLSWSSLSSRLGSAAASSVDCSVQERDEVWWRRQAEWPLHRQSRVGGRDEAFHELGMGGGGICSIWFLQKQWVMVCTYTTLQDTYTCSVVWISLINISKQYRSYRTDQLLLGWQTPLTASTRSLPYTGCLLHRRLFTSHIWRRLDKVNSSILAWRVGCERRSWNHMHPITCYRM